MVVELVSDSGSDSDSDPDPDQKEEKEAKWRGSKSTTDKYGTKVSALLAILKDLLNGSDSAEAGAESAAEQAKPNRKLNLEEDEEERLKEQSSNRIIVFAQWHGMLEMAKEAMEENGIGYVLCKGSVTRRNKALRQFYTQSDIRVIMLSLGDAASGTNLQQASHVVLMDPIAGTKEEADATEQQAIGRAHRQGQKKKLVVLRMCMRWGPFLLKSKLPSTRALYW